MTTPARTDSGARAGGRRRSRARRGDGELLRNEILQAARALLAETGDEDAVSIRSVAQRVGITTPSIYLHFADKRALMDAVCVSVFAALDDSLEAVAAGADGPFDALRLRGRAFVDFALANPEHYRIVFMTKEARDGGEDAAQAIAYATFEHFVEGVQQCIDAGVFVEEDPTGVALALLCAAHGVISLLIAKPHYPWSSPELMIDMAIETAGLGAMAHGRLVGVPPEEIPAQLDRMLTLVRAAGPAPVPGTSRPRAVPDHRDSASA